MKARYAAGAAIALATTPLLLAATAAKHSVDRTALACGTTITASVTLTADMGCAGSNGLIVNANSVVINLNGHTITGDGTHVGVGITGHTNVTVENGVIDDFAAAVNVQTGATGARITNLHLVGGAEGVDVGSSDHVVVSGNTMTGGTSDDVSIFQGTGDQVTSNLVLDSGGDGLRVQASTAVAFSSNKVLNNTSDGIDLLGATTGTVTGNTVNGNGVDGISAGAVTPTGFSTVLTIARNRAAFNVALGIQGAAPATVDGGGNVVQSDGTAVQCHDVVCDEVET